MRAESSVACPDNSISKEYEKAKIRVLRDPDVVDYLRGKPKERYELNLEFRRVKSKTVCNVSQIRDSSKKGYRRFVDLQLRAIDDTIAHYSVLDDGDTDGERPALLCKYMPEGHAVDNVLASKASFGSIRKYRRDDKWECTLPIDPESDIDGFFDVIQARIMKTILMEHHLDIGSVWDKVQDIMGNCYFVGCFSEGKNPEYMWNKYAPEGGICVWFRPDYSNLHKVIYSPFLARADDLRRRNRELMYRMAKEEYDTVQPEFESLVKEIIDLSILSFYTKKPANDKDDEWRILLPSVDDSEIKEDKDGYN